MKTVLKSTKRFLAVFMALAMVVLSMPETAMQLRADTVTRYNAVDDGEGGVTYEVAEDGAFVFDETTGTYVEYTEPAADPAGDPADPASDPIQIDNQGLGSSDAPVVTFNTTGNGIEGVQVFINDATEPTNEIDSGDAITSSDSLVIVPEFSDGYEFDAEASSYTITGESPVVLDAYTIASSAITDDIAIDIVAVATDFPVSLDDTVPATLMNDEGTAPAAAAGNVETAYVFTVVPDDTSITTVKNVKYKVGDSSYTTTGLSEDEGVYTIAAGYIIDDVTITATIGDVIPITDYDPALDDTADLRAVGLKPVAGAEIPAEWVEGEDLEFSVAPLTTQKFIYSDVTVAFYDSGDDLIDGAVATKTGTASDTTITFTNEELQALVAGTEPAAIKVTAVGRKKDVSIVSYIDEGLTVTGAVGTLQYGSPYEFTIEAAPGYGIDPDAVDDAMDAMDDAIAASDYDDDDIIIYAIKTGEELASATEDDIYPIALDELSTGVYKATITGSVTYPDKGVLSDLTVVIGTITEDATYTVSAGTISTHVDSIEDEEGYDVIGADVTHGEDLAFWVTLTEDGSPEGSTYTFNSITYDVDGVGDGFVPETVEVYEPTLLNPAVTVYVVIDGDTIGGNLALNISASEIKASEITVVVDPSEALATDGLSYKVADGKKLEYESGFTATTKDRVTLYAQLVDGYTLEKKDVTVDPDAFTLSNVTTNANGLATITGWFIGEDDTAIELYPEPVHPFRIFAMDPYGALEGLQYGYGATAATVGNWQTYNGMVNFREDEGFVKFRYQVDSSYEAVISDGYSGELDPSDFEVDGDWIVLTDGAAYEIDDTDDEEAMADIEIRVLRSGTKTVYVDNTTPATLTKVAVTVDSGTADEKYFADYAKSTSTKVGVMKTTGGENTYDVFTPGGNTSKSSAVTIAVTAASNYKPVLTSLPSSAYTVTQKGQVSTFVISKDALADEDTITFEGAVASGKPVYIEAPTDRWGDFTIAASIDGVTLDPTTFDVTDGDYTGDEYEIPIGKKAVFTLVPDTNYTLSPGKYVKVTDTKTTETAVTPKADSFTYTITGDANAVQKLRLTATPTVVAQPLDPDDGNYKTKESTAKVNGENQKIVSVTYTDLEPDKNYETDITVGGISVVPTKIEVLDGKNVVYSATGTKVFQIPGSSANKNLTVKITKGLTEYSLYTVKALKPLDSIKVAGTKLISGETDIATLTQEAGTYATYAITANPTGATVTGLEAAVYEDDSLATPVDPEVINAWVTLDGKTLGVNMNTVEDIDSFILIYRDVDDTPGYDPLNDEWMYGIYATAGASKLEGTSPAVTLKKASYKDLTLTVGIPTAAVNSFRNASNGYEFVYEVKIDRTKGSGGTLEEGPFYYIATDTKEDVNVPVYSVAPAAATDFDVTVNVYAVTEIDDPTDPDDIMEAIYDDPEHPEEGYNPYTCIAAGKEVTKSMTVPAARFATSLSVKNVNTNLWAGEKYSEMYEDIDRSVKFTEAGNLLLATIIPDAKATKNDAGWTVTSSASLAALGITSELNEDGSINLVVPSANLDALAATRLPESTVNGEVKVVAPKASALDQEVSVNVKITLNQRAVNDGGPNINVVADEKPASAAATKERIMNLSKKSGTALSTQLPMTYLTSSTKATNNAWTYEFDTSGGLVTDITDLDDPGTYYGFTEAELEANDYTGNGANVSISKTGKLTLNKDFVFTDNDHKTALVTVTATSVYNPDLTLTYRVYFTDSTATMPQGEAVIGMMIVDNPDSVDYVYTGLQILARKGTPAMTPDEFDDLAGIYEQDGSEYENYPGVFLLREGAVIEPDGFVDIDYVVLDSTRFNATSSNTKVATINGDNEVRLTGEAVGNVTFTVVPENTGVKKTVPLNLKAATFLNTKTAKDYYSLAEDGYGSATNVLAGDYNEKNPTLALEGGYDGYIFDLQVLKGTAFLNGNEVLNPGDPATAVDDFYSNSALKAGTGVTILAGSQGTGRYTIAMYGAQGKVTLNGVTYTLTNADKNDTNLGAITQVDSVYGNYNFAQTPVFAGAKMLDGVAQVLLEPDVADTNSLVLFEDYFDADDPVEVVDGGVVAKNQRVTGFVLPLEAEVLPTGTFTFYATWLDDGDDPVSAPQKVTLKVTNAPTFTPVTTYAFVLDGDEQQVLTLVDKNGNEAVITSFSNVLDTKTGTDNNFVGLVDEIEDGALKLQPDAILLEAPAADRTGWITYTADGGVTFKTVKVTLSFTSDVEFYATQLATAIDAVDDEWSAQYVTNAKALEALKSLISLPSNINVSWASFTAPVYSEEFMTGELGGTLLIKNTKDKNDPAQTLDVALHIPAVTLDVDGLLWGVDEITYTAKDAGKATLTATLDADGLEDLLVPNGTTLAITKLTADPDVTAAPDSWFVYLEDNTPIDKKTGPWTLGILTGANDGDELEVVAENTITLTKGSNIDSMRIKYIDAWADSDVTVDYKKPVLAVAKQDVTVYATPKAGYDAVLTNKKSGVDIPSVPPVQTGLGDEVEFTEVEDVNEATTFVTSVTPHLFDMEVLYEEHAGDVYSKFEYNETWGAKRGWTVVGDGETFTAPYGQSVQTRLTKKDDVVVSKKAGDWSVTAAQFTGLPNIGVTNLKGSETATLSNYTVKVAGGADLIWEAEKNAELVLTNAATPKNAVSSMVFTTTDTAPAAYTSGTKKILTDGTVYAFAIVARKGYIPVVYDKDGAEVPLDNEGLSYTFGGTMTDENESFTVYADKTTEIGQINLGAGAPDEHVITDIDWSTDSEGEGNDLPVGDVVDSSAAIGETLILAVTTQAGYDLQIQTQSPTQKDDVWTTVKAGTAASAALKLMSIDGAGNKTWEYRTKIADGIAKVALNPVAQARSYKVVNNDKSKSITNMKVQIDLKSVALTGKSYFGATLVITFDAPSSYAVVAEGADLIDKSPTNPTTGKSTFTYTTTLTEDGQVASFK